MIRVQTYFQYCSDKQTWKGTSKIMLMEEEWEQRMSHWNISQSEWAHSCHPIEYD